MLLVTFSGCPPGWGRICQIVVIEAEKFKVGPLPPIGTSNIPCAVTMAYRKT